MSGFYEIEAGETKSPKGYAYKKEGTWLAGRDFPGKEEGERLMEAPDLKVHKTDDGKPILRRPNGQIPTNAEKRQFIEAKGYEFKQDSQGRWQDDEGFVSNEKVYNKLKYASDEKTKGKQQHNRRAHENFISHIMDSQGINETEARRRVNQTIEKRKEIQKKDISENEKRAQIKQIQDDILYQTKG